MNNRDVVILGAGPAGLSCAHELSKSGMSCAVIDQNDRVGGLCRTLDFGGFLFDIGGHRFLSGSREVNALWKTVLGGDLIERQRRSRIFYDGKFYDYPLRVGNALKQLGVREAAACVLSYAEAQVASSQDISNFEGWMIKKFGERLYRKFFKTYTEKVWGIPCQELSSQWASQRIQKLSLLNAVGRALPWNGNGGIKTLSDKFLYPRLGPGQFCDGLRTLSESTGAEYFLKSAVKDIYWEKKRIDKVVLDGNGSGTWMMKGGHFFSSIPITTFLDRLRPQPPAEVRDLSKALKFRSFISVNIILKEENLFSDHWIYVHSPDLNIGRVQNYKNWSSAMVPQEGFSTLGAEYFVTQGDDIWNLSDEAMIDMALNELEKIGLISRTQYVRGYVVRMPHAYPVYGEGYEDALKAARGFLEEFENLQVMGRAGLFRYNNSDHAILTGLYGARNLLGASYDLWSVDPDRSETG